MSSARNGSTPSQPRRLPDIVRSLQEACGRCAQAGGSARHKGQEVDWDDKFEGDVRPLGIAIEISGDNFPTIRREFALLNQTPPSLMPLAPSEQPDNQGRPLGDNNSGNTGGRG